MNVPRRILAELQEHIKALSRRDPKEPRHVEKAQLDELLRLHFMRRFRYQQQQVIQAVQSQTGRKDWIDDNLGGYPDEEEWEFQLVKFILAGMKGGADIFFDSITLQIDQSLFNVNAWEWARKYAGMLIKQIDAFTHEIVKKSVALFIKTPGMTIGDLEKMLPFNAARAESIAVTETTRAYAQGQIIAGKQLKADYPDVEVVKIWHTNNDDRVCELCGPLNDQEVPLGDNFSDGTNEPPRHVNCRCWIQTTTKSTND